MINAVLTAGRVRLAPFEQRHLSPEYVSWLNDQDLMSCSEQRHRQHTLESCRTYWEGFSGTPHCFWAIEALDLGGLHIGNLNAYIDRANGIADMGLLIGHSRARRKGYGQLAWNTALSHLLNQTEIRKVTAGAMAVNEGMLRIAEHSGMHQDGCRSRHFMREGKEVDLVYWAAFSRPTQPHIPTTQPKPDGHQ
ncbi:MAG: GNAT family N-acetyltransferase [Proteobacteria bacterium]|nr:GNAT family N-acetyltransferase [Pseudomonadota bacterium]